MIFTKCEIYGSHYKTDTVFKNYDSMSVDFLFCVKEITRYFGKKMTSLSIKIGFLSGSPLSNELIQQEGNEWDPCCTFYFHLSSTFYFYHVNMFVKSNVGHFTCQLK